MAKTVSLRDLHSHIKQLDQLVTGAIVSDKSPPDLNFDTVRTHCNRIMELLGEPAAQDDTHAETRAEYQRAAKDLDPAASEGNKPPHAADARPRTGFDPGSVWMYEGETKTQVGADFDPASLFTYGDKP